MCGFWASIGLEVDARADATIVRRGPDGSGERVLVTGAGPLEFRFRRLAIYDPSPGAGQPMRWQTDGADPGLWIVFNGAIYNHDDLRRQLVAVGRRFRTRTDTEVLLAAWDQWGPSAFSRLDGMFAFALFDSRTQQLIVARDRFGEKPLHWAKVSHQGRQGIAFASDIRQLVPFLSTGVRVEASAMTNFLQSGLVDRAECTFVDGIRRVPAGSFAVMDLSADLKVPAFSPFSMVPPRPNIDIIDELKAAVELRLKADVPVGACLSGGLDSSIIVTLASEAGVPLRTVTALYDEPELSEAKYLRSIEAHLNLRSARVRPSALSAFEAYPKVLFAQGEPFANTSVISQWLVFAAARKLGLKVMLDGQGADELFGGYAGMAPFHLADLLMNGRGLRWFRAIADLARNNRDIGVLALVRQSLGIARSRRRAQRRLRVGELAQEDKIVPWPASMRDQSAYAELVSRLVTRDSLPALLRYEDRNAMDHGVETRLPFLSASVADFALSLGGDEIFAGGWTKSPLRLATRDRLPEEIVWRKRKLGFATPLSSWIEKGPWREWARAGVADAASRLRGIVADREIAELVRGVEDASADASTVFRVAHFVDWSREFGASL